MIRRSLLAAFVTASLLPVGGALAAPAPTVSLLALPTVDVAIGDDAAPLATATVEPTALAFAQPPPGEVRTRTSTSTYEYVRYRPRRRPRERTRYYEDEYRSSRSQSFGQLHAGFMDLQDTDDIERGTGFVMGFRAGAAVDPHIQIGGMADWRYKGERQTEIISTGPGPGGEPVEVRREFSRSSSNLFPLMGFIQINAAGPGMSIEPYLGAGAGYEVLFLTAEDFTTGEQFDGTFGGFGWQAWAGVGLPLSGGAKLVGEVFINQSEVGRDVEVGPDTFREVVNMDGAGMRFGVSWAM